MSEDLGFIELDDFVEANQDGNIISQGAILRPQLCFISPSNSRFCDVYRHSAILSTRESSGTRNSDQSLGKVRAIDML